MVVAEVEETVEVEEVDITRGKDITLSRVANDVLSCTMFFDWDWCQDNCPLYKFCDGVSAVQDATGLLPKESIVKKWIEGLKAVFAPPSAEGMEGEELYE